MTQRTVGADRRVIQRRIPVGIVAVRIGAVVGIRLIRCHSRKFTVDRIPRGVEFASRVVQQLFSREFFDNYFISL